jgi:hypothetical protein
MFANRKPGLLALLACLAVLGGYGHQLFGQFEHHHLGASDPHHNDCAQHHHGDDHDHHAPSSTPDQESPLPDGDDNNSCDQCPCALIPALAHTPSLSLPALTSIETVPALALSAPGADTRSIDHPPAA